MQRVKNLVIALSIISLCLGLGIPTAFATGGDGINIDVDVDIKIDSGLAIIQEVRDLEVKSVVDVSEATLSGVGVGVTAGGNVVAIELAPPCDCPVSLEGAVIQTAERIGVTASLDASHIHADAGGMPDVSLTSMAFANLVSIKIGSPAAPPSQ